MSNEEILLEYLNFIRTLPDLLDIEKQKVLSKVKYELGIEKILEEINKCDFESLLEKPERSYIIENLSTKLGFSLNILCPAFYVKET